MTKDKNNSLKEVSNALGNLIKNLLQNHKIIYIIIILFAYFFLKIFENTGIGMRFILCSIITITSVIIFSTNNKYSETALSFILGLFMVFSTTWKTELYILFITFYLIFNVLTFLISSVKIAADQETILVQAALKYRSKNYDHIKKELNKICRKGTSKNQLDPIERAESIRYLAYRQVKINDLRDAIDIIELIKTVQSCSLNEAQNLFYNLYVLDVIVKQNSFKKSRIISMLDKIVVLPMSHDEFYKLFMRVKYKVIKGELSFTGLLDCINTYIYEGLDIEEIVLELNSIS